MIGSRTGKSTSARFYSASPSLLRQVISFAILIAAVLTALPTRAQYRLPRNLNEKPAPVQVREAYAFVFRYQMHLDSLPETEDKAGKNNSWRKDEIRRELKFSEWEYAPIRSAAHELNEKLADLASRNNRAISEEQVLNPPPNPLTAETRTKLKQLKSEKRQTINTAVDSLNAALGPELANRLHQYVQSLYSGNAHYGGKRAAKLPANSIPVTASNSGGDVTKSAPRPETICGDACIDDDDDDDDDDDGGLPIDCSESEYTAPVSFSQDGMTVYGFSDEDTNSGCLAVLTGSISDNGAVRDQTEVTGSSYVAVETQYDVTVGDTYAEDTIAEVCGRYTCQTLYGASAGFKTGAPSITQISPQQVTAGAPGTFTVSGSVLAGANNETTAHSDSSGVSVNIGSGDVSTTNPSTATVNYSIDPEAPTGSASFTLSTVWGTSNTASFIVDCGTPSISQLSNSNWTAGQSYTITINGIGFCSNSQVNVSVPSGSVACPNCTNPQITSANSITVTVTPSISDPTETATVTVTNDSGDSSDAVKAHGASPLTSKAANQKPRPNFTCPGCGAATSAPAYANVMAVASQPSIYFNGANITDTSTSSPTPVLVGQQIYLTIQLADGSDPGTVATSIDWTVPGVSIADFSVSSNASSAKVVPLTQTEQPTIVFFWVSTGGSATVPLTVKYSYCVDANKQSCASASATFNVSGPTNATTTAKPGPAELMSYTDGDYTGPSLLFGDNGANPGMTFTAQMNFPSTLPEEDQAAMFVQLVNSDNFKNLTHSGTTTSCTGPANAPALDSHYPMNNASKMVADDVPTAPLEDDDDLEFAESQRLFSAITYLMVPAPSTPCNSGLGVSCSVPVPLGSTTWQFNGNAINTLKIQSLPNNGAATTNNTSYILSSCSGCTSSSPAFVPNTNPTSPTFGYPTWSALSVICDPVASTE